MEKNLKSKGLFWLVLAVLLLIEYGIFHTYLLRDIVPFYPKSYDQTVYLAESYKLYEQMLAKGRFFAELLKHNALSQTLLFHVQGAIVFLVFGANRLVALNINFFYFIFLQLFAVYCIRQITGRYRYGLVLIGLLLTANSLIMASDFRIDFIVSCLYGVLCLAILRADIFISIRWTFVAALIAIFLIAMRYITVCYVLGMLGVIGGYYILEAILSKKYRDLALARIRHMFIYGFCLLGVVVPLIGLNWQLIHDYYIVGHVTGGEKLMRLQVALQAINSQSAYLFYPIMFFKSHFSVNTVLQMSLIIVFYSILLFTARNSLATKDKKVIDYKNMVIFLLISLFVPLIVLTLDDSKSVLVINVILVPFVTLMLFSYIYISEKLWSKKPMWANKGLTAVSVFFLLVGLYNYAVHFSREKYHAYSNDKDMIVNAMVDDIGKYAYYLNWAQVNLSSDYLADYINAPLSPFYYEKEGVLFNVNTLPLGNNGMTPISKQEAFASLEQANIFTANLTNYTPDPVFPFENSVQPFRAELHKMAEQKMIVVGDYFVFNNHLRVYAKPDLLIAGIVDRKITSKGILLEMPGVMAQQVKSITLIGNSDFSWLGRQALVMRADGAQCKLNIRANKYAINCITPAWQSDKPLKIWLAFSKNHDGIVMDEPTGKHFLKRK